jgi:putative ABC transport system substrate-binding protein
MLTALATPFASGEPANRPRVVIFTPLPFDILDESIAGIKEGLASNGWSSEKIDLTEVNANGQMQLLSAYAREIVSSQPAVIVPVSTPATQAIVGVAPETQNIVFSTVTDPAKAKVPAASNHITGVSDVVNYRGNIELLQELFPKARRVGTIYNPGDDAAVFGLEKIKPIFAAKGLMLTVVAASNSNEVVSAARTLIGGVDVIYIGSDSTAAAVMPGLASVARAARVPVIASDAGSVRNGALAAVSVDYRKLGISVARLVANALRTGRQVGEFPRISFLGKTLVLNAETARNMGYHFPASVLARKPEIIGGPRKP